MNLCLQDLSMPMINALYSKHYNICPIYAKPSDQGHSGVARDRVYLILTWRGKVLPIGDVERMYQKVSHFIQKYVSTRPRDYWVSTEYDQIVEATNTARRRHIPMKRVF